MRTHDQMTEGILSRQLMEDHHSRRGAIQMREFYVDTRSSGFGLAHLLVSYVSPESRFHLDESVRRSIEAVLSFLEKYQRPDGCLDLAGCNFASPPDTAFTMNALLNGWWLMEKHAEPETAWLHAPLRRLIESCAEGVAAGGFHTPNHRWAIAACLLIRVLVATGVSELCKATEFTMFGMDVNTFAGYLSWAVGACVFVACNYAGQRFFAFKEKK